MAARSAEKNCKAFDRRKGCYSDCYKGLQREMAARSAGKKSKAFYKGESRYKAFFLRDLAARSAEIFSNRGPLASSRNCSRSDPETVENRSPLVEV